MKRKTIPNLRKAVWLVFSRYIRLRDCWRTTQSFEYGECISCGKTFEYHKLDAGHFIPKHSNNYFSEKGVNAQCRHCNSFLHGNQLGYRRGLVELYGEEVTRELELENIPIKKFTVQELQGLKTYYEKLIKEVENGSNTA